MLFITYIFVFLGDKYQAILFDVDSKDSSMGVSCPPMSFLQYDLLATVAECLDDSGKNDFCIIVYYLDLS